VTGRLDTREAASTGGARGATDKPAVALLAIGAPASAVVAWSLWLRADPRCADAVWMRETMLEDQAAEVAGDAVGGLVDRHPFKMIFALAAVPVAFGAWLGWAVHTGLGLGVAGTGVLLVLAVLPALVRSRRLERQHAAQRAQAKAALDAALRDG
jgi:hypothetical protein